MNILTAAQVDEIERSIETSTTMRSDVRALCASLRGAMELLRARHSRLRKVSIDSDGSWISVEIVTATNRALAVWDGEKRDESA